MRSLHAQLHVLALLERSIIQTFSTFGHTKTFNTKDTTSLQKSHVPKTPKTCNWASMCSFECQRFRDYVFIHQFFLRVLILNFDLWNLSSGFWNARLFQLYGTCYSWNKWMFQKLQDRVQSSNFKLKTCRKNDMNRETSRKKTLTFKWPHWYSTFNYFNFTEQTKNVKFDVTFTLFWSVQIVERLAKS